MDQELKLCPNCGKGNLHHYKISRLVECNDCSERMPEDEWQLDTPREHILRAELARKDEEIKMMEGLIQERYYKDQLKEGRARLLENKIKEV